MLKYTNRPNKLQKYASICINYTLVWVTTMLILLLSYILVWIEEDKEISEELVTISEKGEVTITKDTSSNYPLMDIDYKEYKIVNTDVKGWLNIPVIDLSIPVVQGEDNEFYLTHDYKKEKNKLGWVFVDARSNLKEKTQNTIIYGHNSTTGKMFGNLKEFLNLEEVNSEAKTIYFNTDNEQRLYEIFSVYVTDETDWSYIQSGLNTEDWGNFLKSSSDRNKNTNIATNTNGVSEIITFSTCYGALGTSKRLVIHAKIVTKIKR